MKTQQRNNAEIIARTNLCDGAGQALVVYMAYKHHTTYKDSLQIMITD